MLVRGGSDSKILGAMEETRRMEKLKYCCDELAQRLERVSRGKRAVEDEAADGSLPYACKTSFWKPQLKTRPISNKARL